MSGRYFILNVDKKSLQKQQEIAFAL